MDGVEGGFVDDTFLEKAFELLFLGLASQHFPTKKRGEEQYFIAVGMLTFLMFRRDRLVSMMVWRSIVVVGGRMLC